MPGATARGAARVTAPRRDPSELARLMDTTTGMTSLQETLQTDRALLAAADEPATVALSELKPPSFKPHPWAAMTAALARPVPLEPLAAATPAAFYYVRFRNISHLIHLRERLEAGLAPALAGIGRGRQDYDLAARYEAELGLRQGPLTKLLGPTVVDDLAVVGSNPYLREGSDLSMVFRVRARPAFEAALAGTLAAFGAAHGGLKSVTIDHQGTPITITRSSDGVVRRHRATVGGFDVVSNSLTATKTVIDAVGGARHIVADEPDFRYMLARDAATPGDVLAFLSDRFVGEVIGPRQKVLEARRQIALAELSRPGYAALLFGWMYGRVPASADEIIGSGLLKRDELAHPGGERIDWQPGRGARSSWGAVGGMTPLIDLPAPAKVTSSEKAAYDIFVTGYQSFWRTSINPICGSTDAGARRPRSAVSGRARAAHHRRHRLCGPAADGRARARRPAGRYGRSAHGDRHRRRRRDPAPGHPLAARDADDRVIESGLAGRLGDGGPGRHRHAGVARSHQEGSDDRRVGPLAARPGRPARVRGHGGAQPDGGGGIPGGRAGHRRSGHTRIDPVGRGRARARRSFRGRASRCGVRRGDQGRRPLLRVLQERARAVAQRIGAAPPHRRLPRRPAAPHAVGDRGGTPAVDLNLDMRERGPLWWRLAFMAARGQSAASARWSTAAAEAVLRGAPGASPSVVRMLARDTLGAIPVTPEGYAYALGDDGLRDPLRGVRHGGDKLALIDLLASEESPFVRLGRLVSRARSEVAFDDEPGTRASAGAGGQPARSLHVKLRLEPGRGAP